MRTKQQLIDEFSDYVEKKDREVRDLQEQLREARRPRNRMVLVGGPMEGDTVLVAPNPSSPYYIAVTPRRTSSVQAYDWTNPPMDFSVEQHFYRMQRVHTGDGDRYVGLYERTR